MGCGIIQVYVILTEYPDTEEVTHYEEEKDICIAYLPDSGAQRLHRQRTILRDGEQHGGDIGRNGDGSSDPGAE